ncbi:MAG TPA: nitroreductase family deazaflavin-dependent oxidoreductase [Acidimicrobiales bacterium]|nr:nitroreductase family deazaflavin-dependent oxidoreductase [Acidimicrobiales bacterium]
MHLPRALARINRRVVNPIQLRYAGIIPGHGIVGHRGRRTGRSYQTPVLVFHRTGGFSMIVGYGVDSDWVRNLLAGGGGELQHRRKHYTLSAPRLVRGSEAYEALPSVIGLIARLAGVEAALLVDAEASRHS